MIWSSSSTYSFYILISLLSICAPKHCIFPQNSHLSLHTHTIQNLPIHHTHTHTMYSNQIPLSNQYQWCLICEFSFSLFNCVHVFARHSILCFFLCVFLRRPLLMLPMPCRFAWLQSHITNYKIPSHSYYGPCRQIGYIIFAVTFVVDVKLGKYQHRIGDMFSIYR